jgi:hypothetical protein
MNETTNKRMLLFVAVGLLTATAGASEAAAQEQCQIQDPDNDPGGEVTMSSAQLQQAAQHPNGGWVVFVTPEDLAGIDAPPELEVVKVRLSNAQYATAVDLAQNGAAVFAVHSEAWVEEMEQRLLGGFSVLFNGLLCPYAGPSWT